MQNLLVLDRKIGANRCQILKLECIKFNSRWGSAALPQTPFGELTVLPSL